MFTLPTIARTGFAFCQPHSQIGNAGSASGGGCRRAWGLASMKTVCVRGGRNTLFQPKSPVRRNDALCLIRRRQDSLLIRPCGIPVRSGRVRSRLVRPRCRTSHRPCQTRTRPHLPFAFYETCYRVRHSRSDDAMNIFATRTIELFATQHCHRRPCMRCLLYTSDAADE